MGFWIDIAVVFQKRKCVFLMLMSVICERLQHGDVLARVVGS